MSKNVTVKCGECDDVMRVIRVSRQTCRITDKSRVKCFCQTCGKMRNEYVLLVSNEPSPPAKVQAAPKTKKLKPVARKKSVKRVKKKRAGPVKRTYAGLKGTRESKREWTFKYSTDEYGPLWLKTTKNTWNNWSVWWAAERVASGDTIKEALEKAKKRLTDRGYILTEGKS